MGSNNPPTLEKIKQEFVEFGRAGLGELLQKAQPGANLRDLEKSAWSYILHVGRMALAFTFGLACRSITEAEIAELGIEEYTIRSDYWYTITTTLGKVSFPLFAYRVKCSGGGTTHVPASKLFKLRGITRSSTLALEWEALLGAEHPFRTAERLQEFFSHSALKIEDNTINRHATWIGAIIDIDWLFLSSERIKQILGEKATLDKENNNPIIYISTDAHVLRRFVDKTWDARWRNANGLRLWCIDRGSGRVIHLGGMYTWGDCQEVEKIVRWLISTGRLPSNGDFGGNLRAQIVWVTDAVDWVPNRIYPLFHDNCIKILDLFHVAEHIATYANTCWGKGNKEAMTFYSLAMEDLLGPQPEDKKMGHGYQKASNTKYKRKKAHNCDISAQSIEESDPVICAGKRRTGLKKKPRMVVHFSTVAQEQESGPQKLIQRIKAMEIEIETKNQKEAREQLLTYIENNSYRMDYMFYRKRGYQVGSGAMESLHRIASQLRLKLSGARWLEATSRSIFNLRMLSLLGRWEEFWSSKDLEDKLKAIPVPKRYRGGDKQPEWYVGESRQEQFEKA
jgi:hypothetical protein